MEFVLIMYRILCYLEKYNRIEKFDDQFFNAECFHATDTDFVRAIEELIKKGCVDGIYVERSADDSIYSLSIPAPRITYDGIEFLHTNSLKLEADKIVKSKG